MKTRNVSIARVAGLFIAAAVLASCYAPIANQNGFVSLNVTGAKTGPSGSSQVIVLVVNSDSGDNFKDVLNLISKAYHAGGSLTGDDAKTLTSDAKELATVGLVKFGGFPFYQTTIVGSSGSFSIPGLPAGRDYFVKLFVFDPGFDFKPDKIDQNFGNLIQLENMVFTTETYSAVVNPHTWVPVVGQPVTVNAGASTSISMTLTSTIP